MSSSSAASSSSEEPEENVAYDDPNNPYLKELEMEEDEDEDEDEDENDEDEANNNIPKDDEEEDDDEDDDDEDEGEDEDNEEDQSVDGNSNGIVLGGTIRIPAYALLAGVVENTNMQDPNYGTTSKCQIPITHLPTVLGREHKESNINFVSLGQHKLLSRNHCTIFYRDKSGGRLGQYNDANSNELVYTEKHKNEEGEGEQEEDILRPEGEELPPKGFFVMQSLSKNNIFVNGLKVGQGQTALLRHKTPISIGFHSVYFLLPSNDGGHDVISIPQKNASTTPKMAKRSRSHMMMNTMDGASIGSIRSSSVPLPPTTPSAISSEFDNLPLEELLTRFSEAIDTNQWDRKHQMLGSAIAVHAVRDAALSSELQKIARIDGKVCRADVMKWISTSPMYTEWVSQMLTKMELKSYQGNIGKALMRAGYERFGSTGRQVRWTLPRDLMELSTSHKKRKVVEQRQEGEQVQQQQEEESDDDSSAVALNDDNHNKDVSDDDESNEEDVDDQNDDISEEDDEEEEGGGREVDQGNLMEDSDDSNSSSSNLC